MSRWINIDDERNVYCGTDGMYAKWYIDTDVLDEAKMGVEERKGKWKILRVSKFSSAVNRVDARCSECNVFCSGTTQYKTMPYKFCPNCGARMEE